MWPIGIRITEISPARGSRLQVKISLKNSPLLGDRETCGSQRPKNIRSADRGAIGEIFRFHGRLCEVITVGQNDRGGGLKTSEVSKAEK